MKLRFILALLLAFVLVGGAAFAFQRGFGRREFGGERRGFGGRRGFGRCPVGEPEKTEWTFARLAYGNFRGGYYGAWDTDYPCAEFHFSEGVRRLTRINTPEFGAVINPDSDDIYEWPWMYAVEVGSWGFSPEQAERMRKYLERGGFLMIDDFHGEQEWQIFELGMRQIFPDRPIIDLEPGDPIYRIAFDVKERLQVPGPQYMGSGLTYERYDGVVPHWRGIRDDQGRIMVAISHDIDYGEGWEQADNPAYPEPFTRQSYEVGINYILYAMTH